MTAWLARVVKRPVLLPDCSSTVVVGVAIAVFLPITANCTSDAESHSEQPAPTISSGSAGTVSARKASADSAVADTAAPAPMLPADVADAGGAPMPFTVFAAPEGDGDECSVAQPCSITAAKAKVQALPATLGGDVVVELSDGVYRLKEPLRFSAADSGRGRNRVIWRASKGAHPILSGAMRVAGWELDDAERNIWRASVPANTHTRQLYVNGVRTLIAQGAPPVALAGDASGYTAADRSYATWRNPSELEFVYPGGSGAWTEPRCRVAAIDGTKLTMSQPCWNNATNRPRLAAPAVELPSMNPATPPTRIENAYELMQPGQWYLDSRASALLFWAPERLDMTQAEVELPILEQLLVGEGSLDEPVHDLEFRGIEFAYATWNGPSSSVGFAEIQANITITGPVDGPPQGTCNFSSPAGTCPYGAYSRQPGHVVWHAAKRITLVDNLFTHLGAAGLVFEFGSQDNRIEGNVFRDISGIGIQLGSTDDPEPSDARAINTGNLVANNLISDIGVEYHGAVGIMVFFTQRTVVRNNEIHDVPYTGISSGAVAGHANVPSSPETTTNINAGNQISHNVIYRYLTALNDGGAIYLEGPQYKTVYDMAGEIDHAASYAHGLTATGNVVFHQGGHGNALYDDIGSQWITWRDNIQWQAFSGQGGCLPVGHFTFAANYHSDRIADFGCGQPNDVVFQDNHMIPRRPAATDLPAEILRRAGLEAPFRRLATQRSPVVQHVNPSEGKASEDTRVLIAGSGFHPGMEISWNELKAVDIEVLSSNFVFATAPQDADLSQLRVKTDGGSIRMRINDTDPAIEYSGNWTAGTYWGNYDNDTQHFTEADDAAFSYKFEGTGIDFISASDSNRGLAEIYVDGALVQTVSCFAPSYASQQVCARIEGLSRGVHSLRVVKKSGRFLSLDTLQIRD